MTFQPDASAAPAWLPQSQLAELHRSLANAQDSQIAQLVTMIDRLRDRGTIDDLVAPFRSRLAQLRPARPLRFIRLLFTPLDPVIVPAPRWQLDGPSLPRSALPALAWAAHATMGVEAEQIDAMLAGHSTRDTAVIAQAGILLWPRAAQALLRSQAPPDWIAQTGLPAEIFKGLAANVAAVLDQVLPLQTLRAEAEMGVPLQREELVGMLRAVIASRPQALSLLVALLLARLPQAAPLLREAAAAIGDRAAFAIQDASRQAGASLLERLETEGNTEAPIIGAELAQAAAEVRRISALLQSLETDPLRSSRIRDVRRRLEVGCRTRFTSGLEADFLRALEQLDGTDEAVARLEEAARGLRALGTEGRRFDNAKFYDALLEQTIQAVKAIAPGGGLTLADKVRLIEILAGPDEAWALLDAAGAASSAGSGR